MRQGALARPFPVSGLAVKERWMQVLRRQRGASGPPRAGESCRRDRLRLQRRQAQRVWVLAAGWSALGPAEARLLPACSPPSKPPCFRPQGYPVWQQLPPLAASPAAVDLAARAVAAEELWPPARLRSPPFRRQRQPPHPTSATGTREVALPAQPALRRAADVPGAAAAVTARRAHSLVGAGGLPRPAAGGATPPGLDCSLRLQSIRLPRASPAPREAVPGCRCG